MTRSKFTTGEKFISPPPKIVDAFALCSGVGKRHEESLRSQLK